MRATFLLFLSVFSISSFALVDMKSANYTETWTHLVVPGVGYDLRVTLGYNSRSLFNGIFGYGWCSDYETKIEVTPESNLKLTECGGGMETVFTPRNFNPGKIDSTIKIIMADIRKRRPEFKPDYLAELERELRTNDFMREEFSRRLNIRGRVDEGNMFLANGREAENITIKNGVYKRTLSDGTYQMFDAQGRLTNMYDRNQNYLKLNWEKDQLTGVADNLGRKLTFRYDPTTKKVAAVIGPNNMSARFVVKGEDLVEVIDAENRKITYAYDDVHNLTRIDEAGEIKVLTYNKDKDWVTSFRNPRGCVETYDYQTSKTDPKNYFWSEVVKRCNGKVTNQSKYEFWHKERPNNGGVYLSRVKTTVNGQITEITYHEAFGKPLVILRDNVKTEYAYYDNGFVRTKKEPQRLLTFEYKNSCNKVSTLVVQDTDSSRSRRTAASQAVRTRFGYDPQKCNLVTAETSDGQRVKLQYDDRGRIAQIEDQSKKLVRIKYEAKFGKPSVVTRPGLGSIRVTYKNDGEIAKVESKEGPNVAMQVSSIFNNLLDIIAPATGETPL